MFLHEAESLRSKGQWKRLETPIVYISTTDLFKIGIGPSSSHTVGPMRAARRFLIETEPQLLPQIAKLQVELFGSLAHTGKGHATDLALQLGLSGELPDTVDTEAIGEKIAQIARSGELRLLGEYSIRFHPAMHIRFNFEELLPVHSNAM